MTSVLVTHADEPIGRRIIKRLYHDERIENIFALGSGPPPRAFDRFLAGAGERMGYARIDLAKHRPVADLFHSGRFRAAAIDTVVYVPRHGSSAGGPPMIAGLAERTAEARLILQHSLEVASIRSLVAIGSAFVYRLTPGNANRVTEESELDLDPGVPPAIRSWIDCDMIFHGEVNNEDLRIVLLRVPTVVSTGGYIYMNPCLADRSAPRFRPLGFDPLCALVSDKDVACAVALAVSSRRSGIYNIAGIEAVPLSMLARWTGRPTLPVPGVLLQSAAWGAGLLGVEAARSELTGPYLRYGFTLDTDRAEHDLGFRPGYRIGLARAGDGVPRLETAPV